MNNSILEYFLEAYLSATNNADIESAIRNFSDSEGLNRVNQLKSELEEIMRTDASTEMLTNAIVRLGNYYLPENLHPFNFITELYNHLQLVGPTMPYQKPFDVFISYNKNDTIKANIIYNAIKRAGFKVWLDGYENMQNINKVSVSEILLDNIKTADFLIVIVSNNYIKAKLNANSTNYLSKESLNQKTVIIPIRIEDCEIPKILNTYKYIDAVGDKWEQGVRTLLVSLEAYRSKRKLSQQIFSGVRVTNEEFGKEKLEEFYGLVSEEIKHLGWPQEEAFKDVIIGPVDGKEMNVPRTNLADLIKSSRVELRNWGGDPFPHAEYSNTKIDYTLDGLRLFDNSGGLMQDWSFYYWKINDHGYFMQRSHLDEDHMDSEGVNFKAHKLLFLEWTLKDICMPLMFAHRLCIKLKTSVPMIVKYNWSGMKDRKLILLDRNILPLYGEYKANETNFIYNVVITRENDLQPIAENLIEEILSLFKWDSYPKNSFSNEIRSILSGTVIRIER